MPKVTSPIVPLQGLFGLIKPSGPTSMSLLDALKPLFLESSLFVTDDAERKAFIEARKKRGGGKAKAAGSRGRNSKNLKAVKIGQGGTLDPLADGVLVVGLNKGTKSLSRFLDCSKEYYTTAILGCETDTYDSEGSIVQIAPYAHVTPDVLREALATFKGEISQLPPIYSALKMDGKPLYEYARNGLPLPRPIEARKVNVLSLELVDWQESAQRISPSLDLPKDASLSSSSPPPPGHHYSWPERRLNEEQIVVMGGVRKLISTAVSGAAGAAAGSEILDVSLSGSRETLGAPSSPSSSAAPLDNNNVEESKIPPVFTLKMTVSSGTYVRSIVNDLAHAVGSAAHVVSLSRTRQGDFAVGPKYPTCRGHSGETANIAEDITAATSVEGGSVTGVLDEDAMDGGCIPWAVFERAIRLREEQPDYEVPVGEREDWEQMLLARFHAL